MKRIAVGVLSLGVLAAQARYDYYGEGTTMRPDDTHAYTRQRFEGDFERGTSGPLGTDTYHPDYYGPGTKMRPMDRGYDHQRFEGDLYDRTTGGRWIGSRRRHGPYFGHAARYAYRTRVGERHAERRGWFGRGNAYDGPGIGGHADRMEWES